MASIMGRRMHARSTHPPGSVCRVTLSWAASSSQNSRWRDDEREQRDRIADLRDLFADRRDHLADHRDRVAHDRDVAADHRDRQARRFIG